MSEAPRVLSVGRLYCDLIFTDVPRFPSAGTEVFAGNLGLHAGGGAYITAAHLSALGVATDLAATLPCDPFAAGVSAEIGASGVGTAFCRAAPAGAQPQVTVAIVTEGNRSFLTRRTGPAFPAFDATDLRRAGIAHVHIGELATLIEAPDLIDLARDAGATVSLDCSWDDDLKSEDARRLVPRVDVFLPNADEMRRLRAMGLSATPAPLTIVKRGADGACAVTASGDEVNAPAHPTRAVDTTGAGDAFNAGFLSQWLLGAPVERCLRAGNARGALAVAATGGVPAPQPEPARAGTG